MPKAKKRNRKPSNVINFVPACFFLKSKWYSIISNFIQRYCVGIIFKLFYFYNILKNYKFRTKVQGKIDLVRVLNILVHCFRLPPRSIGIAAEVSHIIRGVRRLAAHVTRLFGHLTARLHAKFCWSGLTTRVGGVHFQSKCGIFEARYASL